MVTLTIVDLLNMWSIRIIPLLIAQLSNYGIVFTIYLIVGEIISKSSNHWKTMTCEILYTEYFYVICLKVVICWHILLIDLVLKAVLS